MEGLINVDENETRIDDICTDDARTVDTDKLAFSVLLRSLTGGIEIEKKMIKNVRTRWNTLHFLSASPFKVIVFKRKVFHLL